MFRLLPRPTRTCPQELGYHEVKAYGELLYRSRLELRTTPADLAAAVGCERWHTLPKIIRRLQEHGLADEQLKPLQDAKGYFHRKKNAKRRWQNEFQTTTIYLQCQDALLADVQNTILWTIHSFNSMGKKPPLKSVATLLRLDYRTVTRHLKVLQEQGCLDVDLCVTADPRHWQDAAPKPENAPEVRWDTFAAEWVGNRYGDGYNHGKPRFALAFLQVRQSLCECCTDMAAAGYTSVQICDYWEQVVPDACGTNGQQLLLMEYFVERVFYKMFAAVETVTNRNRQVGKFHGENSFGLLRKVTAGQIRTMRTCLLERGVQGLEFWSPDFSSLGVRTLPKIPSAPAGRKRQSYDRTDFERLFADSAPALDRSSWVPRLMESPGFKDDPHQLFLECSHALDAFPHCHERNLERVLHGTNGKA
jgi:hypothetical protein